MLSVVVLWGEREREERERKKETRGRRERGVVRGREREKVEGTFKNK